ncbi:MAG TPA: N-acetyltransferase [Candidatus Limnocylindrales bacterium]|nr:N-acetyltransferase [Candidatus Limnocylindrales bacterium]
MIVVRPERPEDVEAIRAVERAAFGGDAEAALVDALRAEGDLLGGRSLVAEADGAIVGHLALSPCTLEPPVASRPAPMVEAIGPVAVEPGRQRQGIGTALMHAAIDGARRRGVAMLVLLGHPSYYPRFGFVTARALGALPPADWNDEAWMALPLGDWRPASPAVVRYPRAFGIG